LAYFNAELAPVAPGKSKRLRLPAQPLDQALKTLEKEGILRNASITFLQAQILRRSRPIAEGTYEVKPGMTANEVIDALRSPMRQMVRLPETNWARRTANLLEKAEVCTAAEYLELVRQPKRFKETVSFPVPEDTLEGYLYPDTYDLPPLLGAEGVILRQLRNFERRVWRDLDQPRNLDDVITKASLVEMEVARDEERPIVAGVIENRLRKGMRLQIDASINYGIQKWRPLLRSEYKSIDSPYNLYRVNGLPPTPICSPTVESIRAVLNPARHPYLYYVAMPSGESRFAADIKGHNQNFAARKAALRALELKNRKEEASR
jgi:UPF0755 protein